MPPRKISVELMYGEAACSAEMITQLLNNYQDSNPDATHRNPVLLHVLEGLVCKLKAACIESDGAYLIDTTVQ